MWGRAGAFAPNASKFLIMVKLPRGQLLPYLPRVGTMVEFEFSLKNHESGFQSLGSSSLFASTGLLLVCFCPVLSDQVVTTLAMDPEKGAQLEVPWGNLRVSNADGVGCFHTRR